MPDPIEPAPDADEDAKDAADDDTAGAEIGTIDDALEGATPVCPRCFAAQTPPYDFCPACAAPVGMSATMDPFKSIRSEWWAVGEAITSRRPTPILLIGLWLFLMPGILAPVVMLIIQPSASISERLLPIGILLAFGTLLVRATRGYRRALREARQAPEQP